MTATPTHTVLMVPGLRDHVAEHWQTLLQAELQAQGRDVRCVPPLEHDKLSCAARVAALDAALADIDKPVVLVAHSAGVMITVHWAARHQRRILGALLVTPPDFSQPLPPGYPAQDTLVQGAGCRRRSRPCRSPAWLLPAETTHWPAMRVSRRWPPHGAAGWWTWATSATSTLPRATARGRVPMTCWRSWAPWSRTIRDPPRPRHNKRIRPQRPGNQGGDE